MGALLQNPAIQHLIAGLAGMGVLGGLLATGTDPNGIIGTALVGLIALLVGSTATNLGNSPPAATTTIPTVHA